MPNIDPRVINGPITADAFVTVDGVTAAKDLSGLEENASVMITGAGLYLFSETQSLAADDQLVINVTSGGQLVLTLAHPDLLLSYTDERVAAARTELTDNLAPLTGTYTFPSNTNMSPNTRLDITIPVAEAVVNDSVVVNRTNGNLPIDIILIHAYVSADGVVTATLYNTNAGNTPNVPAGSVFKATVFRT